MDELDALARVCEMRAVLARAGRRDLADLAWAELCPAGVPLRVRYDALKMAGYLFPGGTESSPADVDDGPDPEDPWSRVAALESRWQQMKDYLDANRREAANDHRQWEGSQPGTARAAKSETLGLVRARMEEIEAQR